MLRRPGAPTIAFALLQQSATNTSARARSAGQPRTSGAFANEGSIALATSKAVVGPFNADFAQFSKS